MQVRLGLSVSFLPRFQMWLENAFRHGEVSFELDSKSDQDLIKLIQDVIRMRLESL